MFDLFSFFQGGKKQTDWKKRLICTFVACVWRAGECPLPETYKTDRLGAETFDSYILACAASGGVCPLPTTYKTKRLEAETSELYM